MLHIIVTFPTLGLGVVMLESSSGDANALAIILVSLGALYFLAVFIPNIALSVRRLHDLNLTGWIYLGRGYRRLYPDYWDYLEYCYDCDRCGARHQGTE